jgi:hypothetical protein
MRIGRRWLIRWLCSGHWWTFNLRWGCVSDRCHLRLRWGCVSDRCHLRLRWGCVSDRCHLMLWRRCVSDRCYLVLWWRICVDTRWRIICMLRLHVVVDRWTFDLRWGCVSDRCHLRLHRSLRSHVRGVHLRPYTVRKGCGVALRQLTLGRSSIDRPRGIVCRGVCLGLIYCRTGTRCVRDGCLTGHCLRTRARCGGCARHGVGVLRRRI